MLEQIKRLPWDEYRETLHEKGFVIIDNFLTHEQCDALKAGYEEPERYRKTINMERYRFGKGEYKYFRYPLPPLLQSLREAVYEQIAGLANQWMQAVKSDVRYPPQLAELHKMCAAHQQVLPTVLILKYQQNGFNTLHQDLYGDVFFPLQMVFMLSEPDKDYSGGEFVITEQIPRAQSKANVLKPKKGSVLIFATNYRPVRGTQGYYRVNMKHGVSTVHGGERFSLGVIFHDALT
ncbi:2OG-Fe(II) oxygenase [Chitinophaga sp. CB10]|uniref:2OG-Fe(II) oxygenase n=1 Tax=Chitinophaga sp. CB10 TaxID=1891659 RepID=UPI000B009E9A|nr:2OG-Fe(II) oxygenase [Chitinophaga sp. CB10]